MDIVKIAIICIISSILCKIVDKFDRSFSLYIKIFATITILLASVVYISPIFNLINSVFEKTGGDVANLNLLFKAVGICYITDFAENICKDSGESTLANAVQIAGKITITLMSIPLIESLLEVVLDISN